MLLPATSSNQHSLDTQVPPPLALGTVLVVTADADWGARRLQSLNDAGWRATAASPDDVPGTWNICTDLVLLDPLGHRATIRGTLERLSRARLRPSVVLALRRTEDLEVAILYAVACVDARADDNVWRESVARAHAAQRVPRGGGRGLERASTSVPDAAPCLLTSGHGAASPT